MRTRTLFHLSIFVLLTIIITACDGVSLQQASTKPTVDSNAPRGYMDAEQSSILFLQWTEKSGQMSGQLQDVYISSSNALQTQHDNEAFTGTHDGSNVSISTSIFGFTKTYTGSLNGDTLTLVVPSQSGTLNTLTLHSASVDDYNKAATTLIQNTSQQALQVTATTQAQNIQAQYAQATASAQSATATAQANQQQSVSSANNALSSAIQQMQSDAKGLGSDTTFDSAMQSYANDWSTMQKAYQQEQTDAKGGCSNVGTVGADNGAIGADNGAIGADDGSFQAQQAPINNDISTVQQDIQTVQSDWQSLQSAAAANTTGTPAPAYTQDDVNKAVQAAQGQINTSQAAIKQAQGKATGYDQEASQMVKQADALANGMHC